VDNSLKPHGSRKENFFMCLKRLLTVEPEIISINESVIIGVSLSLNCIVTGLGAGLSGLSVIPVIISVFFFSLLTISSGYELGIRANFLHFGHLSEFISGALLVAIGIRNLI